MMETEFKSKSLTPEIFPNHELCCSSSIQAETLWVQVLVFIKT